MKAIIPDQLLKNPSIILSFSPKYVLSFSSTIFHFYMMIQQTDKKIDQVVPRPKAQTQTTSTSSMYVLMALSYKSSVIYRKSYCSSICQLITPIICLLFAMAVRIITQNRFLTLVQPFHFPYINKLTTDLNIRCAEQYYYSYSSFSQKSEELVNTLFSNVLKTYCSETQQLEPEFIHVRDPNQKTLQILQQADKKPLFRRGDDLNISLPDGLAMFHNLQSGKVNMTLAINDWRYAEYHTNNGVSKLILNGNGEFVSYLRVTEGLMSWIEKITRSFLQTIKGNQIISGFFMYMPFSGEDNSLVNILDYQLGTSLYPLGLSIFFPIILFNIVQEKQEKLIEIMKINGLYMRYYWINFFLFNFIVSLSSAFLFFIFGKYVFHIVLFTSTNWLIIWTLFLGWTIAQISSAAFIQIFINNSKAATIFGYIYSFFGCIIGSALNTLMFPYPDFIGLPWMLVPILMLSRGVYLIGAACSNNQCFQDFSNLYPEMYMVYIVLFLWIFVFVLAVYLHGIVQQEYGTAHLPQLFKPVLNCCKRPKDKDQDYQTLKEDEYSLPQQQPFLDTLPEEMHLQTVDESVSKMATFTFNLQVDERPLIVKKLQKVYENGFQALKPNTFHLEACEIFGLLGTNGAGKTTLISVLTGMYESTSGMAWIDGKEVGTEQANSCLGVCPQFDVLWPSLSIEEHLYFYSMLKGVDYAKLDNEVNDLLRDVDLLQERDMRSDELSGGMKRRLSLAIALAGRPKVVILDEPSSGLDPMHRRQMWNILLECKKRTTILLTTHLMEEAEALCDRLGVIHHGLLRCIGTQQQLKDKFGKGYSLSINFKGLGNERESVLELMRNLGCQMVDNIKSTAMVKVPKERLLDCMRKLKDFHSLKWLLSQPSLYDVFMHFAN